MQTNPIKLVLGGVAAFVALFFILGSFTVIDQTERGVLTQFGEVRELLEPGLHFVNPFTQNVYRVDVTVNALPITDLAYSRDSQVVEVAAVVNYQIDSAQVLELWKEVRNQAETRYVLPRSQEAIKQVISGYTAQGLVDNRGVLSNEVRTKIAERLIEEGIFIADVSITNLDFDDAYEAAVQNKQVQEQQALAQANITRQEEEKKQQAILQAEAIAEKTRLEVQALALAQSDKVIEKILAEAQLEAAKRWNGQTPTTMVVAGDGSQLPLLPYMNLGR